MKNTNPSLTEIVSNTPVPKNVDPLTAVIAHVPSPDLDQAVGEAIKETQQAASKGSGWEVNLKERSEHKISGIIDKSTKTRQGIYKDEADRLNKKLTYRQLEGWGNPTDKDLDQLAEVSQKAKDDEPSEEQFYLQDKLRRNTAKAREEQEEALRKLDELQEQTKLFTDITEARRSLSRPIRYAATVLCAAVVGLGSGGVLYKTTESAKQQASTQQADNPKATAHEDDVIPEIVGVGGAIGGMIIGGTIGGAVAQGQTGRLARIRAKRIVKKSQISK